MATVQAKDWRATSQVKLHCENRVPEVPYLTKLSFWHSLFSSQNKRSADLKKSTLGVVLYVWNRRTKETGQAVFESGVSTSTLSLTQFLVLFLIHLNSLINQNVVISVRLAMLLPSSGLLYMQLYKLSWKHFEKHMLCNIEKWVWTRKYPWLKNIPKVTCCKVRVSDYEM